jgi:ribonucleoside-diphosphate reductase alpha chain
LRVCLDKILTLLETKEVGTKLLSTEVSDISCFIADAVLSGGIRRAALICLFDADDARMLHYKSGAWWELHPERGRVNVSAVCHRETTEWSQFKEILQACEDSNAGEPGIFWTSDFDLGSNPCCEISLRHKEFCNLTTINFSTCKTQREFKHRIWAAAFLGTLQAGFTDFHYLTTGWGDNCKEEALLGVSVTGIADNPLFKEFDFEICSRVAMETNAEVAEKIGINKAARVTAIKPEGTASLVLGTSSGIHGRHAPYYIRRWRLKRNEPIAVYLGQKVPQLVVDDETDPDGVILELPQQSPEGSIMRDEHPLALLERAKHLFLNWVKPGHRSGANFHNVSCTVSVKPDEWAQVGEWMWENRENYAGISALPADGGSYRQAPFEACTKDQYDEMMEFVKAIDLSEIVEDDDATNLKGEAACVSGQCELP